MLKSVPLQATHMGTLTVTTRSVTWGPLWGAHGSSMKTAALQLDREQDSGWGGKVAMCPQPDAASTQDPKLLVQQGCLRDRAISGQHK